MAEAENLEVNITVKDEASDKLKNVSASTKALNGVMGALSPEAKNAMGAVEGLAGQVKALAPSIGLSTEAAAGMSSTLLAAAGPIAALVVVAGSAIVAFTAMAKAFAFAMSEAEDAQVIEAQLGAVIKSTGGAAGMTSEMIQDMAKDLSAMSGVEDDLIIKSSNLLLTFTHIGKDVFPQAQQAALDISQAFGMDLSSASVMLGKALEDPATGMSALRRVGVSFTEEMVKAAQSMVDHGQIAQAQALILGEVSKQVAGSAAAMGATVQGEQNKISNLLKNMAEDFGAAFLPLKGDVLVIIRELLTAVSQNLQPAMVLLRQEVRTFQQVMREPEMKKNIDELVKSLAQLFGEGATFAIHAMSAGLKQFMSDVARNGPAMVKDIKMWVDQFLYLAQTINRVLNVMNQLGLAKGAAGASMPGYAAGVTNAPGGVAWVGEDGPEPVFLPRGSTVVSNSEAKAALAGGGNGGIKIYGPISVQAPSDGSLSGLMRNLEAAATATA